MTKQQWSLVTDVFKGQIRTWGTRKPNKWDTVCFLQSLQTDTRAHHEWIRHKHCCLSHLHKTYPFRKRHFYSEHICRRSQGPLTHIYFTFLVKDFQSQRGVPFLCPDFSSKVIEEAFIKLAVLAWLMLIESHFNREWYHTLKNYFPIYRWYNWCKWGWRVALYGGAACLNRGLL